MLRLHKQLHYPSVAVVKCFRIAVGRAGTDVAKWLKGAGRL